MPYLYLFTCYVWKDWEDRKQWNRTEITASAWQLSSDMLVARERWPDIAPTDITPSESPVQWQGRIKPTDWITHRRLESSGLADVNPLVQNPLTLSGGSEPGGYVRRVYVRQSVRDDSLWLVMSNHHHASLLCLVILSYTQLLISTLSCLVRHVSRISRLSFSSSERSACSCIIMLNAYYLHLYNLTVSNTDYCF